ncbi:MAG: S9 family peptidase, partial [Acidobacteria bacterium]|nr:S9 family peptidase [Acidobacteriota bacterium]
MRRMWILLGFCLATTAFAAGEKRMTVEDSLSIRDVGAPRLSPDGRRVAYTITEWVKDKNTRVAHIYLTTTDGRSTLRLTNGEKGESSPQWSPDGSRIGFMANRDQANQVWTIGADGGEAEKLTTEEGGVTAFCWSPDGKKVAYLTRDVPGNKEEREKKKKDKFDAIVVDQELLYSHLWVIDLDTKSKKRLTEGSFSVSSPQWSPDGKWLAFVTSASASQESSYKDISADRNTDIHVVSADGGAPRLLTPNPGIDGNPRWSPDGKEVAYTATDDPKSWAAKTDLMVIPAQGGAPRNLTRDFMESVGGDPIWSPDGKGLFFGAGVGVYSHLYSLPAAGGRARQVTQGDVQHRQFDIGSNGKTAAFIMEGPAAPGDIWITDLTAGGKTQITFANPQAKDFALADTEVIRWKGPDGFDIEGILVKPLGYETGKRYPLILQIHGGPYGRFSNGFNSRAQIFAANGYAILMPNPRGSTGYGIQFTQANVGDWGGKDYQDYVAGADAVIARGIADSEKLLVMGGSYGGFSTFWTITQTDRF